MPLLYSGSEGARQAILPSQCDRGPPEQRRGIILLQVASCLPMAGTHGRARFLRMNQNSYQSAEESLEPAQSEMERNHGEREPRMNTEMN